MAGGEEYVAAVRRASAHLPDIEERLSHGVPALFVRGGKAFVYVWWCGHHDNEFPQLWCAAAPGVQEALTGSDPRRFFRPPYVGYRGWIGVRFDAHFEPDELAELCEDAYRAVAPTRLIRRLDASIASNGEPSPRRASAPSRRRTRPLG